jgi:hypothetical protein
MCCHYRVIIDISNVILEGCHPYRFQNTQFPHVFIALKYRVISFLDLLEHCHVPGSSGCLSSNQAIANMVQENKLSFETNRFRGGVENFLLLLFHMHCSIRTHVVAVLRKFEYSSQMLSSSSGNV